MTARVAALVLAVVRQVSAEQPVTAASPAPTAVGPHTSAPSAATVPMDLSPSSGEDEAKRGASAQTGAQPNGADQAPSTALPQPVASELGGETLDDQASLPPGPPTGTTSDADAVGGAPPRLVESPPERLVLPPPPALGAGWAWVDTVPAEPASGESKAPKRSRLRGSRFDWTHSATTTLLGVGADYQSSAYQVYRQGYSLFLNYFVYDGETVRIRVSTAPGMDVELTNSDITTTQREPWFRDLPVAVGLNAPIARDDERLLSTLVGGNLVFVAPTSKASRASGHYMTISPRVNLTQALPLRGPGAAFLDDIELWVQARYDHLFSRAATPVDSDLDVPRRSVAAAPGNLSDVLNGSQIAPNGVRLEASSLFSEELFGRPLFISVSADYTAWALAGVTSAPPVAGTGGVSPEPEARTVRKFVGVGLDVTWQAMDQMSVAVGYGNTADLDNIPSNNPLYSPYATFLAGLVLHIDSTIDALINQDKNRSPLTRRGLASAPLPAGQRTW